MRETIGFQIATLCDTKSMQVTEDTCGVFHNCERIVMMVADGAPQRLPTTGSMQPMLEHYGKDTTPGRYAAYLTRDTILELAQETPDRHPSEMARIANDSLRRHLESIYGELTTDAVLKKEPQLSKLKEDPRYIRLILPICCVTIASFDVQNRTLTYAHGGDTALFALYKDGRTVQITPDQMGQHDNKMREEIHEALHTTNAESYEELKPHLRNAKQIDIENGIYHNYEDSNGNPDSSVGVGVINGLPQLMHYLVEKTMMVDDIEAILLTSDGFFWPAELDETDEQAAQRINRMGEIIRRQGLQDYLTALRNEEKTDPYGKKYQRFARFDDATAVMLSFNS